jgi:hypothetical protein
MNVKIWRVTTDELVGATIRNGQPIELPSIQSGWKFNFNKQIKKIPNATAYVLVSEETPEVVEGCLIFQLQNKEVPFMSFVEVAPHNKVDPKKYLFVGGCLIAFACKQSFIKGKGYNKGWLTFEVSEEDPADQIKLMGLYSQKYKARRLTDTNTMLIGPDEGEILIKEYLERG